MTKTPEQIKAFLDDLARISVKHGLYIELRSMRGYPPITEVDPEFIGYLAGYSEDFDQWNVLDVDRASAEAFVRNKLLFDDTVVSLDVSNLSAHERMAIKGGLS